MNNQITHTLHIAKKKKNHGHPKEAPKFEGISESLSQIITQYLGGILENNECLLLRNIMSIGTFIFLLCPDEGALFDQRSMHNNG